MEWLFIKHWWCWLPFFYAIIVFQIDGCNGYFPEEKKALLDYKEFLKLHNYSANLLFPSWVSDPTSDCCTWKNVTCDSTTGHVTHLGLSLDVEYEYDFEQRDYYCSLRGSPQSRISLNLSLFQPLKKLRNLNLSKSCLDGLFLTKGHRSMATLKKLETLDLSKNFFDVSVMRILKTLTSLKNLILQGNQMKGNFPIRELSVLQNLEKLDSSDNQLNNSLSTDEDVNAFSMLKKLEHLNLGFNNFDEKIFKYLSALPTLKFLFLQFNYIKGALNMKESSVLQNLEELDLSNNRLESLSTDEDVNSLTRLNLGGNYLNGKSIWQDLCNIKTLQELDISSNKLNGTLHSCLGNLTSLQTLDVSDNDLSGSIPSSLVVGLASLEYLSFSVNNFEGTFSLSILANHSRLKVLEIAEMENNKFQVETENPPNWIPSFQLKVLYLYDCQLNSLTRTMPSFLLYQHGLEDIDLSENNLVDMFPNWLLVNNPKLEHFRLSENSFSGSFQLPTHDLNHHMDQLVGFDISNNKISGCIPENIGSFFPRLTFLTVSNNNFDGEIPASIGEMSDLEGLYLSNNNFSDVYTLSGLNQLRFLHFDHNQLAGEKIWQELSVLQNLEELDLSSNKINSLSADKELSALQNLQWLDLSYNQLSSPSTDKDINAFSMLKELEHLNLDFNNFDEKIFKYLSVLPNLTELSLRGNNIKGALNMKELSVLQNLKWLDLSSNEINSLSADEDVHSLSGLNNLTILNLGYNNLHGENIWQDLCNMKNLKELNVSFNGLNGTLDACLGNLTSLQVLDLSHNSLSGSIPSHLVAGVTSLVYLDLSSNNFEGGIPKELCKLALEFIDLSQNRFFGSIPSCLNMPWLSYINLQGNSLAGTIPTSFSSGYKLRFIDLRDNKLSGSIPEGIYGLTDLTFLLLGGNALEGELSKEICKLRLQFLDLSHNKFIGSIPPCFNTSVAHLFSGIPYYNRARISYLLKEEVSLITKNLVLSYKSGIIKYIFGMDLSFNHLTGEIPNQLGELSPLQTLNLSHNHLNGTIPESFCNLVNIESLDLSYNYLRGNIPIQLQDLNSLAIFNVSYNNLSGRVPEGNQFGTFDENSYKGNPYLLWKNSNRGNVTFPPTSISFSDKEKDESALELAAFYWSFGVSFVIIQLTFVAVLWINPQWRRAWFYFIETCLYKCFGEFLQNAFY